MDVFDLKALLQPVSDDTPAGDDLAYDPLFGEMERTAKGRDEQQFGDTLIAAEEPDWHRLRQCALAVLERSRDLRAAVQLTRAMLRLEGYGGLAGGLDLIRGYLEEFWESLHPRLDPDDHNDPTLRINTLLNLCDSDEFLLPISKLPLVSSERMGTFSHRQIQIASGTLQQTDFEQAQISKEQIEAAFRQADPARIRTTRSQIRQCTDALAAIRDQFESHLGGDRSLDLQPLADQLQAAEKELALRSWFDQPEVSDFGDNSGSPNETTSAAGGNRASGAINNRDDVIRSLDRICHYYARNEPSSPVPLLLQRARRLVTMGFHEIVQDLAPEGQSHFDFLWRQGDS